MPTALTPTVRQAQLRDRDRLIDLYQALNRHEDGITGDRRTDREGAEENLATTAARLERRGGLMLVAEVPAAAGDSDLVVGFLALAFEEDGVYVRPERRARAHITELAVDDRYRRRGIGAALMDAAERLAAERGYRRLTISVMAGNHEAEAAYARQGFRPLAHDLEKAIGGESAGGSKRD